MTNWLVLVFAFHWLRLWHKFSGPSTQRGKAKPKQSNITFDTQLENVLTKLVGYPDFVPKLKPSARKSGSMNITISPPHWKMSLKKSIIIAFKRELIQIHVARIVCFVSLQQKKNRTRLFMTSFPMDAMNLIVNLGHTLSLLSPPA